MEGNVLNVCIYVLTTLYCINSLSGQSGRSPVYHGVQMYNRALFPFFAWVQYLLKYFECLKVGFGFMVVVWLVCF